MHAGTLIAPALSQVAMLSRATDFDTPTAVGQGRRGLLRALAGPASTTPFHRPPRTRPTRSLGRPVAQADQRCGRPRH
jgi:hypothetical protein